MAIAAPYTQPPASGGGFARIQTVTPAPSSTSITLSSIDGSRGPFLVVIRAIMNCTSSTSPQLQMVPGGLSGSTTTFHTVNTGTGTTVNSQYTSSNVVLGNVGPTTSTWELEGTVIVDGSAQATCVVTGDIIYTEGAGGTRAAAQLIARVPNGGSAAITSLQFLFGGTGTNSFASGTTFDVFQLRT